MALTACNTRQSASPTETPAPTSSPDVTEAAESVHWLETETNGVSIGVWYPAGWETDLSDGLVLAEQTPSVNGISAEGILIHCFVPALDEFTPNAMHINYAWEVLDWVVKMPNHTGWDVVMTAPRAFVWSEHNAAYYLYSTGDGVRAVVLALALPNQEKVVICNVSSAMSQANRIRASLPQLLAGLMIDGTTLDSTSLDTLPDPLMFPLYSRSSPNGEQQISATVPQ
ncbi:MAG: hypothetical protein ABI835_05255 [Chloroflexota bacterium]